MWVPQQGRSMVIVRGEWPVSTANKNRCASQRSLGPIWLSCARHVWLQATLLLLGGSTIHGLQDTLGSMSRSLGSERTLLSDKNELWQTSISQDHLAPREVQEVIIQLMTTKRWWLLTVQLTNEGSYQGDDSQVRMISYDSEVLAVGTYTPTHLNEVSNAKCMHLGHFRVLWFSVLTCCICRHAIEWCASEWSSGHGFLCRHQKTTSKVRWMQLPVGLALATMAFSGPFLL